MEVLYAGHHDRQIYLRQTFGCGATSSLYVEFNRPKSIHDLKAKIVETMQQFEDDGLHRTVCQSVTLRMQEVVQQGGAQIKHKNH